MARRPGVASPLPQGRDRPTPAQALAQLDRLAGLLDARWRIPGTPWRVGVDGLVGLIPGVGDAAGLALSGWLLALAHRAGAGRWVLARMSLNVLADTALGAIPLVGDVFDIAFKANTRNARLLRTHLERRARKAAAGR